MEPDRVLEVPDIADRLARPYCDASSSQQIMEYPNERYSCQQTDLCGKDIVVSSSSPDGTEKIFRNAESARSLFDTLDDEYQELSSLSTRSGIGQTGMSTDRRESMEIDGCHNKHFNMSYLTRCRNARGKLGLEQVNDDNESLFYNGSSKFCAKSIPAMSAKHSESGYMVGISQTENILQDKYDSQNFRVKRKNIDFCYDSQPKSRLALSRALPVEISQGRVRQKRLVGNGDTFPCNMERNMMQSELQFQRANAGIISDKYNSEEVNLSEAGSRIKQRRLVQGEHISKNEGACCNKKLKEDKIENMVCKEMPNGPSTASSETENIDADCYDRYEAAKKEKKASTDDHLINEPHRIYVSHLSRPYERAEDNMTIIGQNQNNVNVWTVGNPHWRRMHNRTGQPSIVSSSEDIKIHKIEASLKQGARCCLNNAFENSETRFVSELDLSPKESDSVLEFKSRSKGPNKRGRKCRLMFNSHGKSASSFFNDSEVLYLGTSQRISTSSSTRNQTYHYCNTSLDSIIKFDKLLSPDATFSATERSPRISYGSRARIRQIESDELFARQLQEQMFNESQRGIGIREIDAALALSLQQEEHAQFISSDSKQDQHNARNRFVVQLHSQVPSRNYKGTSSTIIARVLRGINLKRMDKDTRDDIIEEIEAALDNGDTMSASHIQHPISPIHHHNFSENDYEMLLSLDDNNRQPSYASEIQINTLPQSVLQTDDVEACAICLDKPSVGDTIRHLPCLHKFHKDCIDEWLRRRTICPLCNLDDFFITTPRLS